jgi:hypothetical protein
MILTDFLDRFLESSRDARCYTQHEIFTPTIVYLIQPVLEFQKNDYFHCLWLNDFLSVM